MKPALVVLYILNAALCLFLNSISTLHFAACMGWLIAALWLARVAYLEKGSAE